MAPDPTTDERPPDDVLTTGVQRAGDDPFGMRDAVAGDDEPTPVLDRIAGLVEIITNIGNEVSDLDVKIAAMHDRNGRVEDRIKDLAAIVRTLQTKATHACVDIAKGTELIHEIAKQTTAIDERLSRLEIGTVPTQDPVPLDASYAGDEDPEDD